jgi:insulysin
MHDNFDHEKLEAISDMLLDPKNVLIMLRAKCLETDQTEKWYGTKYRVENISESLLDKITRPNLDFTYKVLDLPPANTLLPSGVEIVSDVIDKVP